MNNSADWQDYIYKIRIMYFLKALVAVYVIPYKMKI